jgi:ABC-2 type transport system permease protein
METDQITDRGRGGSSAARIALALAIAFLLYITIVLHGQSVLRGVLEEKQSRVAEVVLSSVRADVLLAGKVLGVGAVGLTQTVIWIAGTALVSAYLAPSLPRGPSGVSGADATAAMSAFDLPVGIVLLFVLFFLLGYIFYSALFAAVGAMVNDEREAQQALQPVIILLVASAIFIQPVAFNPTGTLARVTSILPFSSPIIMPMRMSITSVPPGEIAASILGLIVGCVAAVWVAARIYRVGLLMYGKRPSARELMRWIRYA